MKLNIININTEKIIDTWENYPYIPSIGNTIVIQEFDYSEGFNKWIEYTVIKVLLYKDIVEIIVSKIEYNHEIL